MGVWRSCPHMPPHSYSESAAHYLPPALSLRHVGTDLLPRPGTNMLPQHHDITLTLLCTWDHMHTDLQKKLWLLFFHIIELPYPSLTLCFYLISCTKCTWLTSIEINWEAFKIAVRSQNHWIRQGSLHMIEHYHHKICIFACCFIKTIGSLQFW